MSGMNISSNLINSTYILCNESNNNFTYTSIFCNKSYYTFSTTTEDNEENINIDLQNIVQIIVPILFGIIFIVGLIGNSLVVIVVACNQQMRNTTNLLIINLAGSDLLFIIFCVPFTATDYILSYWPFGIIWCKMVQYLIIVTAYASILTLVYMSIDRFLAVVYPIESISIRTEKNTIIVITITWIIILLSCIPAFLAHGLEIQRYGYEETEVCMFKNEYNHVLFQIIFMLTSYAIPLIIICLLYFAMLFRLWKIVSNARGISNNNLISKKRVTRMVIIVVCVFAICWLPIHTVLILKSLKLYNINNVTITIQITSHVLVYMNSCINPLLYAFLSENFRKAFCKIIQCRWNIKWNERIRGRIYYGEQQHPIHQRQQQYSETNIDTMNLKTETTLLALQCERESPHDTLGNQNGIVEYGEDIL